MRTKVEIRAQVGDAEAPVFVSQPSPVPVDFQAGKPGEQNVYYDIDNPSGVPLAMGLKCSSPLPGGVTAACWGTYTCFQYDGRENPAHEVTVNIVASTEGKPEYGDWRK